MTTVPFQIVIPARFASTRLPGKPLVDLGGAPMVVRVWECARRAGGAGVVVATDHPRVADVVREAGGEALMTRADHESGTDRLAEVAAAKGWGDDTIVVNVQGDEPLLPPALPMALAEALAAHPTAGIATMAARIHDPEELFSQNAVKTVLDDSGFALLFSRAPIPWIRDEFGNGVPAKLPDDALFLRHIGLYAYRVGVLRCVAAAPRSAIERAESLEQLRAMTMGIRIHVTVLDAAPPAGVDTPEDLERARAAYEATR